MVTIVQILVADVVDVVEDRIIENSLELFHTNSKLFLSL